MEWRDLRRPEVARRVFEAGVRADPSHLPLWQAWGCMEAKMVRVVCVFVFVFACVCVGGGILLGATAHRTYILGSPHHHPGLSA